MPGPIPLALGGSALLGGLGGLFGSKKKATPQFVSPEFNKTANRFLTQDLSGLRNKNLSDLEQHQEKLKLSAPARSERAAESINLLGGNLRSAAAHDPFQASQDLLTSRLGSLRGFVPDLLGSVNRRVSDERRALGLGGRPTSIYGNTALASTLGESLAPILGGIFGRAGSDAESAERSRMANLGITLQLLREREQIPLRDAATALLPIDARNAELGSRIGALGGIGTALKNNLAGFNIEQNPIAGFAQGALGGLGTGTLLAGLLPGGGGAGGGLGGFGGGYGAGFPGGGFGGFGGNPYLYGAPPSPFSAPIPAPGPDFLPSGPMGLPLQ